MLYYLFYIYIFYVISISITKINKLEDKKKQYKKEIEENEIIISNLEDRIVNLENSYTYLQNMYNETESEYQKIKYYKKIIDLSIENNKLIFENTNINYIHKHKYKTVEDDIDILDNIESSNTIENERKMQILIDENEYYDNILKNKEHYITIKDNFDITDDFNYPDRIRFPLCSCNFNNLSDHQHNTLILSYNAHYYQNVAYEIINMTIKLKNTMLKILYCNFKEIEILLEKND